MTLDTTRGPLLKRSLQLAIPAVLQALLVNFYAFNDYFFVGLSGDEAATAALSACFALVIIANTVVGIFPVGGLSLMAQSFGAKRPERVASLLRSSLGAGMVWSLALGVLAWGAMGPLTQLLNVTAPVGERIGLYMGVLFLSLPMFALMRSVTVAYYACGDTRTPLLLEFVSLIVNTALNYVLVLGAGPIEAMGIQGAAIATVVSRALPGFLGLWGILRGRLGVSLSAPLRAWVPRREDVQEMARIGFFESLSGMLYGVVYLMLNRIAGEIGPAAQGGLGAGLRGIEWIAFAFGDGFLKANAAVVGQNIGAGEPRRALIGAWINAGLSALSCQLVGVSFLIFPEQLCAVVTDDPATLGYAARYVEIIGWVMWAVGLEMAMYGALIGKGWTGVTVWVSGLNNMARVPLAAALVFGLDATARGTLWALTGVGEAPAVGGSYDGLAWAIAVTAVIKALIYGGFFAVRRELS